VTSLGETNSRKGLHIIKPRTCHSKFWAHRSQPTKSKLPTGPNQSHRVNREKQRFCVIIRVGGLLYHARMLSCLVYLYLLCMFSVSRNYNMSNCKDWVEFICNFKLNKKRFWKLNHIGLLNMWHVSKSNSEKLQHNFLFCEKVHQSINNHQEH
jgi:hypothetical protein